MNGFDIRLVALAPNGEELGPLPYPNSVEVGQPYNTSLWFRLTAVDRSGDESDPGEEGAPGPNPWSTSTSTPAPSGPHISRPTR